MRLTEYEKRTNRRIVAQMGEDFFANLYKEFRKTSGFNFEDYVDKHFGEGILNFCLLGRTTSITSYSERLKRMGKLLKKNVSIGLDIPLNELSDNSSEKVGLINYGESFLHRSKHMLSVTRLSNSGKVIHVDLNKKVDKKMENQVKSKKAFHTFEVEGRKVTIAAVSRGSGQVSIGYSVCMIEDEFKDNIAKLVSTGRALKKPLGESYLETELTRNHGILKSLAVFWGNKVRKGEVVIKGIKSLTKEEKRILKNREGGGETLLIETKV